MYRQKDYDRRLAGALVGLAVGDALGTTLEFTRHSSMGHGLTDMIGGGPFHLAPGEWTDDTSMALCLAESLIAHDGYDVRDQLARYLRWYEYGENTPQGRCVDIGNTVRAALHRFKTQGTAWAEPDPMGDGNGSLMRMAPVALRYHNNPAKAVGVARMQSRATHGGPAADEACAIWTRLILGAAATKAGRHDVFELLCLIGNDIQHDGLRKVIDNQTWKRGANEIRGDGYVILAFEAALWAFYHGESFEQAVLLAANLGEDADTTAAITGQLAGAYYGLDRIPERWRKRIYDGPRIERLAFDLIAAGYR